MTPPLQVMALSQVPENFLLDIKLRVPLAYAITSEAQDPAMVKGGVSDPPWSRLSSLL
jgi:hypothetical protein